MSSPPWKTDRDLNLARATRVLHSQFPDLSGRVDFLGAGWDYDAYLLSEAWVFRFPRRTEVAKALEREATVLESVVPRLAEVGVAAPHYEHWGRPDEDFPYRFAGYRKIPGQGGDHLDPSLLDRRRLAEDLGRAFSQLHTTTSEALGRATEVPHETESPEECFEKLQREVPPVGVALPHDLRSRCEPYLDGTVEVPPFYPGPERLIHDDIAPEHVIVDVDGTGRLSGLIDWSDLAWGDPALDFVKLYGWLGRSFVEELLELYTPTVDEGFLERVTFLARAISLDELSDQIRWGTDSTVQQHLERVRVAFADG